MGIIFYMNTSKTLKCHRVFDILFYKDIIIASVAVDNAAFTKFFTDSSIEIDLFKLKLIPDFVALNFLPN